MQDIKDIKDIKDKAGVEMDMTPDEAAIAADALRAYTDRLMSLHPTPGGPLARLADEAAALHASALSTLAGARARGGATLALTRRGAYLAAEAACLLSDWHCARLGDASPLGETDTAVTALFHRLTQELRRMSPGERWREEMDNLTD